MNRAEIGRAGLRTAVVGGGAYALSAVAVTGLARLLTVAGLPAVDATALAQMLGFVLLLVLVVAGFAMADVRRLLLPFVGLPAAGWLLLDGFAG